MNLRTGYLKNMFFFLKTKFSCIRIVYDFFSICTVRGKFKTSSYDCNELNFCYINTWILSKFIIIKILLLAWSHCKITILLCTPDSPGHMYGVFRGKYRNKVRVHPGPSWQMSGACPPSSPDWWAVRSPFWFTVQYSLNSLVHVRGCKRLFRVQVKSNSTYAPENPGHVWGIDTHPCMKKQYTIFIQIKT